MTGYIKSIVSERGFGFIRDASGSDVFFHRTGVLNDAFNDLQPDDEVTFENEASAKGPRATNVEKITVPA